MDELLRSQAQAAAVPVDAAQRLCIANLEADLSEARSALAQVKEHRSLLGQLTKCELKECSNRPDVSIGIPMHAL